MLSDIVSNKSVQNKRMSKNRRRERERERRRNKSLYLKTLMDVEECIHGMGCCRLVVRDGAHLGFSATPRNLPFTVCNWQTTPNLAPTFGSTAPRVCKTCQSCLGTAGASGAFREFCTLRAASAPFVEKLMREGNTGRLRMCGAEAEARR